MVIWMRRTPPWFMFCGQPMAFLSVYDAYSTVVKLSGNEVISNISSFACIIMNVNKGYHNLTKHEWITCNSLSLFCVTIINVCGYSVLIKLYFCGSDWNVTYVRWSTQLEDRILLPLSPSTRHIISGIFWIMFICTCAYNNILCS